jgi:hypothetical protein
MRSNDKVAKAKRKAALDEMAKQFSLVALGTLVTLSWWIALHDLIAQ